MASASRMSVSDFTAEELERFQRIDEPKMSLVTTIVQDIVRHIRRNWRVRTLPKDPRKVICRTSQVMHYEPYGDEWEVKHESEPWWPYRDFGGVELDTEDLVLDHLVPALDLTEEYFKREKSTGQRRGRVSRWSIIQSMFKEPELPPHLDDITGISTIRESLKLILELYRAIKGKRTFPTTLWELRKREEDKKAAKPAPIMQAIPLMDYEDPHKKEKEALLRERKIRNFCLKLERIHHILNSILHMKDKEIRQKNRLTTEAIIQLRTTSELDCQSAVPRPSVMNPFGNTKVGPLLALHKHEASWVDISDSVGRKPPLWQNLDSLSPSMVGSRNKIPPDDIPAECTIRYLRSSLYRMLERTRSRHLHQLERLDRELVRRYKYTFMALSVLPLPLLQHTQIYDATLRLEESVATAALDKASPCDDERLDLSLHLLDQPGSEFVDLLSRMPEPITEVHKEAVDVAVWYQLLQEESRSLRIADAEQVVQNMKSLIKFNAVDMEHVSHAQEKLCMLLMSMSAQDMCTKHWQVAAKFVLEEILEGAEGTIELWMNARGLPIMTV